MPELSYESHTCLGKLLMSFWGTLLVAVFSGGVGGFVAYLLQERKLRKEYQLQDRAECLANTLLSTPEWELRSFKAISAHLGGFSDEELRRLLVRAGAVRFKSKSGTELWGLLERNKLRLTGTDEIPDDPLESKVVK